MPGGRMDHQALGLVDDGHIFVLVDNLQRDVLGGDIHLLGLRDGVFHRVSQVQPVILLGKSAVQADGSGLNELLGGAAAQVIPLAGEEGIQPLAVLIRGQAHFFSSFQNSLLKKPRLTNRARQPQVMKQSATLNTGKEMNWVSIMSTT